MTDALAALPVAVTEFDPDLADGTFTVIDRAGKPFLLPGVEGMSLMEIIRDFDLPIPATCGGAAACGTCHVYVDAACTGKLAAPREEEEWQLDHLASARPTSRLACQIVWQQDHLDGLVVTLAPLEG